MSMFFDPKRCASGPATSPTRNVATAWGSRITPDSVIDAPRPYPVAVGICRNSGMKANPAYIATPNSSAERFVVQTPRMRIMPMSISGCAARDSAHAQTVTTTTAAASSPSTAGEPQPQVGASLTASSRQTSQTDSSAAVAQFTEPPARDGDSGTSTYAATAARTS